MKIWQAYGPNYDDRAFPPYLGIFQGEKEDVIDWVDANHPGFRENLEGRKFPIAELKEIKPKKITREMVENLCLALKQKAEADEALEQAKKLT